jgi:hypothetical protein
MAITKTDIITLIDERYSLMEGQLNTMMSDGTVEADELELLRLVAGLHRCASAKTWVEANL